MLLCTFVALFKQLFNFREKVQINTEDEEKPFLDHLTDLRAMLLRMAVTLVLMTICCFSLAPQLMDFLRRPVDKVWNLYEEAHLTPSVTTEEWVKAKEIAAAALPLSDVQRSQFLKDFDEKERDLVACVHLLKAAKVLPSDQQVEFLKQAAPNETVLSMVLPLHEDGAILADGTGQGSLKMMGAFQPGEAFMLSIKLAFYAGIVLSFPLLLYFLLQFIVPGLHDHERKLMYKYMGIGFGLFLVGTIFCYWVVLPKVLTFFFTYSIEMGISNEWRIGYYLSFATQLILMFGVAFELPVVVMPFVKMGILTYDMMKATRRYAIVAIVILAAIITPTPDMATMSLMAVPMYALYECCIWMAWLQLKKDLKRDEAEREAEAARIRKDYENQDTPYHLN